MSNTVFQLKHSTVTGNTPSALANGEVAINTVDGKLFYSKPDGTIKTIVTYPGPSGLNGEIQFNDNGTLGASGNLSFNKTTNTLSVPVVSVNTHAEIKSTAITTINTDQIVVHSFSATSYRSAKYLMQITSGSAYQMIELSLIHNGTTVYMAQYGDVRTGSSLGNFDAEIVSGDLNVLFTPVNAVTTVKAYSLSMAA